LELRQAKVLSLLGQFKAWLQSRQAHLGRAFFLNLWPQRTDKNILQTHPSARAALVVT